MTRLTLDEDAPSPQDARKRFERIDKAPDGVAGTRRTMARLAWLTARLVTATAVAVLVSSHFTHAQPESRINGVVRDATGAGIKAMAHQASLEALRACVDTFGLSNLRGELDAVDVPALILHGTNDKPVPHGITAEHAAQRLPKAKLILYPGASHGLLVTERDRVAEDLLGFLEGVS